MSGELAGPLLRWFAAHGRHDLPWQHPRSAYRVWIAEVMLQQTQVATVCAYFSRFVQALPDLPALAAADEETVLALWSGLGYYRRARHLHAAARRCMQQHGGELPCSIQALQALPGIGRSTAAAILAQAHGERHAILDGNVKRVLSRYFAVPGWPGQAAVARQLWQLAEANTPAAQVADYTQAIMDLGATVCTARNPACERCPLADGCRARATGQVAHLPGRAPRRARPQRAVCMLMLCDDRGRVLLQQRDGHGVWPGLWSLPEAADAAAAAALARRFAQVAGAPHRLPAFEHQFSHFRLHIQPLCWRGVRARTQVHEPLATRWTGADDWHALGLPAPVRRLLLDGPAMMATGKRWSGDLDGADGVLQAAAT